MPEPTHPFRDSSTVRKRVKRAAYLVAASRTENPRPPGEQVPVDRLEIVERGRARNRQSFVLTERDLGRNAPNGPRHGRNHEAMEHRESVVPRDDEHGPALVLSLRPPDLALARLVHQGSSAIMAELAASDHARSSASCGIRW